MRKILSLILLYAFFICQLFASSARAQSEDDSLIIESEDQIESVQFLNDLEDQVAQEQAAPSRDLLQYQTKKGETLMLVAFNLYGDYRKWRELSILNQDVLKGSDDLSSRPVLKYRKTLEHYTPPDGNPYVIKEGDSLSLISQKVYGNWREWPIIYKHNPQQIRDPNLIFAGFTLYYPSLNKMALQLY